MNKKLLETKINSVNHYIQEIKNLEQARKVTESTLDDLVNSFIEFVPYKKGDILLRGNVIFRVLSISRTGIDSNGVWVRLNINYPQSNGGYSTDIRTLLIYISEIENIKIIFSEPERENAQ